MGFLDRHHFLLRRLHSLSGILPVGVFLIFHLLANSTAYIGSKSFDMFVKQIHDLPWLLAIEYTFIFLPLAFHGIYGIAIAWEGKLNQSQYPYMDNWRYTLQRVTAGALRGGLTTWVHVAGLWLPSMAIARRHWPT